MSLPALTGAVGLFDRTRALLDGSPPPPAAPLAPWQERLVDAGGFAVQAVEDEVTVVAADRPGLLGLTTGVLSLHRLDVRSASMFARGATAVTVCRVAPRFGALPDWTVVRADLRRALDGDLALPALLASREAAYAPRPGLPTAPPAVRLVDDASEVATVLEVRARDALGVLHRITTAIAACGLDVRSAHVSTLGADVVDAFYVVGPDGGKVTDPDLRTLARDAVLAALV